ncbi:hypothetical protein COE51_06375 [Bacillus pseudomycoides]|nr:hypothetical protein COE51_06375 [Bacillus pseudomycoides]
MKENYKSATHVGDMMIGIQVDTKVLQKQLKAIGDYAHGLSNQLEKISKEDSDDVLVNHSIEELIEELKSRAIRTTGSTTNSGSVDVLKFSRKLELTITQRFK